MLRWHRLNGPAAILALTLCFFWKLVFTDQYVWFDHPDMSYLEIPRLQFQANEIHRGQFPLWDPHIWAGQPLIGQTQPGMLYPVTLLLALLPLDQGYLRLPLINWYWVLMHFQGALFGYLFARDCGRSKLAAILAGCLFSFSGLIGTLAWLDVINGGVWTPLVMLFLWRSVRRDGSISYAVLGGFTLGLAWLSGHHELPLLTTYLCAFTWLCCILRNGVDWRMMRAAAAFFALLILTSAVQTIPSFEFGQLSMRWIAFGDAVGWKDKIPYAVQTKYSLTSRGIIGLALFGVNQTDTSMFFGCVGLGLALLGAFGAFKQQPMVRWLALVAALTLLYALGAATPFQGLFYLFAPIMDKARIPTRAIQLVHFALAILAAYGADWLSERSNLQWPKRIAWGWLAIGSFLVALSTAQSVMGTAPLDGRVILSGWFAIAAGGLALGYFNDGISRRAALCGLVVLVLSELTMGLQYPNRHDKDTFKFVKDLQANRDIARFLKSQSGPVRIALGEDVPGNFGDWNGINMLQGYVAGTTANHLRHGLHTPQTQRLYGVTHWISGKSDRPGQEIVFTGESGIHVFRNSDTMPRAWAVHAGKRVNSDAELRAVVDNAAFNPSQEVLILNADVPQLESCPASPDANEVRVTRHHSNRVSMRAEMRCKGLVILADTFYPGWQAVVDGKQVPILETYGALRGIVVEKGGHNIEMKFKPWSVFTGAAGFMVALACSIVAWRKRPA